jgi:hypothetical protein
MMRRLLFLLCLLAAALPAAAQSPVRIDPAAGEPACAAGTNPAPCAVALFFACAALQNEALCAKLGLAEIPKLVEKPQPVEFTIDRIGTIEPKDVTDDLKHLTWFRAGYLLVEAQARRCPDTGSCADEAWDDWQIYLRNDEGRLYVVYWRGDSEPDQPPEIPDSFRGPAQPNPE